MFTLCYFILYGMDVVSNKTNVKLFIVFLYFFCLGLLQDMNVVSVVNNL